MRALFVLKAIKHFSYHRSSIEGLCARGHEVRLVFLLRKSYPLQGHGIEESLAKCQGRLTVEKRRGLSKSPFWRRWVVDLRELRSYLSYLRRDGQSAFYAERWHGYLSRFWRAVFLLPWPAAFWRHPFFERVLAAIEKRAPLDPRVVDFIRSSQVDLLIASPANMHHSGEVEYLKAAQALDIPTAVSVLSWDNLTTKGLFHARPELLLAWNRHHVEDAVKIHGFSSKAVKVVGSAFFDKWWGELPAIPSREVFFQRLGLDPARPLILYLGSSPSIATDEGWLLETLKQGLSENADPKLRDYQLLVRPHPGHSIEAAPPAAKGWAVWPKAGALPDSALEFSDFLASLTYCDLTIGLNTSAMIDAVIRGLPCIAYLTPEYARTQVESQHFRELLSGQAVYRAHSLDELLLKIREIGIEKSDPLKATRELFVKEHVRPQGLNVEAGALSAEVLEDFVRRRAKRSLKRKTDVQSIPALQNLSGLVSDRPAPRSGAPRVLIATSMGGYNHGVVMDGLTGIALEARGAAVDYLLCDASLPACQVIKLGQTPFEAFSDRKPFGRCDSCQKDGMEILGGTGATLLKYGEFISAAEREAIRTEVAAIPWADLRGLQREGVPIGEHAYAGALRFFARGDLENQPFAENVLRAYVEAALVTKQVIEKVLDKEKYEVAVVHHGIYVPQGILVAVLKKRGVRVVTWNPAYRKHSFIYSHDDSYHHTMVSEPVRNWENLELTPAIKTELLRYLKSRWHGTEDWIWFHSEPEHDLKKIAAEIGFAKEKPVTVLLSNVVWDAQLHYASNAFPGMVEWVLETIAYFAKRPDLQLVIRVHPAEIRGFVPSRQPLADEIARSYPTLPANVFVVSAGSDVSTYALCEGADAVLIYNTKTGMEVTAQGIPTVVAGEAWIRGKGFAYDPTTPQAYFSVLAQLPLKRRMSESERERAMKYAYHIFFRRMIPVPVLTSGEDKSFQLAVNDPKAVAEGACPGLDVICRGILEGTPFIYPAEGTVLPAAECGTLFFPELKPA